MVPISLNDILAIWDISRVFLFWLKPASWHVQLEA
jgi:hypothetical protein